jgi:hypothetical protein
MKAVLITFLAAIATTSCATVVPPIRWDVETGRLEPRPYSLSIRRGESITIEPRFTSYTVPIVVSNAAIEMRYSAAYDSATYYSVAGAPMSETGRVRIAWSDSLNPTNSRMVYEIRATVGTNILARSYGPLTFLGGMVGINTGLTARTSLNWATVQQANGYAVLSNQLGSGATWSGSNWVFASASVDLSFTNNYSQTNHLHTGVYQPAGDYLTNEAAWLAASNTVIYTNSPYLTDARAWTGAALLGTAAYSNANAFATSNQGTKADGALQA